jgi:putative DNA primase/helicase
VTDATKVHAGDPTSTDDAAEIKRLVALLPLAYERERESAAQNLGVRVSILDRLVLAEREASQLLDEEPDALTLPTPEPWPDAVDGAELLSRLADAFRRYVVMEEGASEAVALWTIHAHALDAFSISPRLAITSAEKRCGKTTLLDVIQPLVPRPLSTANATAPAIFRTVELLSPTLLIDEADTFLRRNDELRGVLNSGHRRATASVLRLDGDDFEPRQFRTWAATAIAMIGKLPDTLADRSIDIRLRRRLPHETVIRFRADRVDDLKMLGRMAARWTRDQFEALRAADPKIPSGVHDRAADNWSPLLAIADEAGGGWPERARRSLQRLTLRADDDNGSIREQLLADIKALFDELERGNMLQIFPAPEILERDRIRSSDLVKALAEMEDRPWPEWGVKQRPISKTALARLLKPFNISPATHRFKKKVAGGKIVSVTEKGYLRSQFDEAFARYLASPPGN